MLISEAVLLKARLGQLGLFRSMHQMDDVTRELGWEVAELDPRILRGVSMERVRHGFGKSLIRSLRSSGGIASRRS